MNWQHVLEINRTALLELVAVMFGMLPEGGVITRAAKRRVLALLLPSEACLRRLIVILTRKMELPVVSKRAAPSGRFRAASPVGTVFRPSGCSIRGG